MPSERPGRIEESTESPRARKDPGDTAPLPGSRWSILEDEIVRQGFEEGLTDFKVSESLPGRTERAVTLRRNLLGVKSYSRLTRVKTPDGVRHLVHQHEELCSAMEDVARMVSNRTDREDILEYISTSLKLHR